MKSPIPKEMRSRTISNIIVVWAGIMLLAVMFYFDRIWSAVEKIVNVSMPFIIGFCIAFLLLPIVNKVEWFFNKTIFRRKAFPKLNRALASLIAFIILLALLTGFFSIMVPQLVDSIKSILQYIATFISMNSDRINELLLKIEFLNIEGEQLVIGWEKIISQAMNYTDVVLQNVIVISSSIYTLVFQLFVGVIAAFYLLMEKEVFSRQIKKVCYAIFSRETCGTLIYWTRRANKIFAGFITGKIIDSLIIGVICYVGMLVFRIEYPLLISVIIGITNILPFFGPFIGAIPSILILLLVNPWSALWFGIFVLVLQQLDGNVIGPRILGDYVGVSPFWIMISIVIGGGLFGFAGMLISVPLFALVYAIVRTMVEISLNKKDLPLHSSHYEKAPESIPLVEVKKEDADEASDI